MLSSLALSIEHRSQPHRVHSLQSSYTPLVSVGVLPAAFSTSLGSVVKAAEPHCDGFAPSSPTDGRLRIVNSIDPAKNSTFLRHVFMPSHRIAFARPRTHIVNYRQLSPRAKSIIGRAIARIHNPTPRNRALHRTTFQTANCSRSSNHVDTR
jgi:hypothetical protein